MVQLMAGSGSSSRKGFPEAGGECCQPQGQEEMMYLEGYGCCCLAHELATHTGKLKGSLQAGASPAWAKVEGLLWMAWRRSEPGCIKNHCHIGTPHISGVSESSLLSWGQDRTTTTQRLRKGQCLAQVTPPGSDSYNGNLATQACSR